MHIRFNVLAVAVSVLFSGTASAQSDERPWNVGITLDMTHQSNPLELPPGNEHGDNVFTTTLRGGVNLPFGRQRAYADAALIYERYSEFGYRNNNGYVIGAGLDWATVERLSGNITLHANQQQSPFVIGGVIPVTVSNIERSEDLIASLRWGEKSTLGLDAAIGTRQVSFSEPQYASSEYRQDNASVGISSGTGGVVNLGAGFRGQRTKYQQCRTRPVRARPKRPPRLLRRGRLGGQRGQHRQCTPVLRQDRIQPRDLRQRRRRHRFAGLGLEADRVAEPADHAVA